jgi:hypothetical protein
MRKVEEGVMDYPFNQVVADPDPPDPPAVLDPSIERFTTLVTR